MTLADEVIEWDLKTAAVLQSVYARYGPNTGFEESLVALLQNPSAQPGATWLLKHCLEQGRQISGLLKDLDRLEHWSAKLHVLQCLPYLEISEAEVLNIEHFLHTCLTSENKFVRAWAYSGFRDLAAQHPRFRDQASGLLSKGLESETAASIKARIRNALKKGF